MRSPLTATGPDGVAVRPGGTGPGLEQSAAGPGRDAPDPASDVSAATAPHRAPPGVRLAGWSLHLPDADSVAVDLATSSGAPPQRLTAALAGAVPAERAHEVLGRKGLLYKEPATRLALCAVQRALGLPPGRHPPAAVDADTAVVVAGNLGNVATVADLARTVRRDGGRAVSALAAPNASSNVVASTVALWFGFGGPNLMICSGATAGLDAVRAAVLLLRAGRAARVVVVGAEPADEVATGLHQAGRTSPMLRAGGACLVLTTAAGAAATTVGAGTAPTPGPAANAVVVLPAGTRPAYLRLGPGGLDPATLWGDCYGAAGVVNAALAAALLEAGVPGPVTVACGDEADGQREVQLDVAREGSR